MQTHQTQSQQAKTDAVPSSTPPVTQPTSPSPTIEPKSNAEGLAEHAERLEKFRKLDTSMVQMGPPRLSNSNPIQPKLTIGAPGDKYEQEADRVAKQVVTQIHSPKSPSPSSSAQRQDLPEEDELMMKPIIQRHSGPKDANPNLEQAINQSRGGGRPLDDKIRGPMEQAFGANFGGVRVHSDRKAHQLNESIQARAFTTGQDLFFRQGAYQPGNRAGQELLAHELTHVVQQNGAAVQRFTNPPQKGSPNLQTTPSSQLPHPLKTQIETLSGLPMGDVNVRYNSSEPSKVGALAYTQGSNIHIGPGQEKHLPHEAWHVVQQKQGRVKPTLRSENVEINDDPSLEHEADVMGKRAVSNDVSQHLTVKQRKTADLPAHVQRRLAEIFSPISTSDSGQSVPLQMVKPGSKSDALKLTSGVVKKKGKKLKAGDRAGGFNFGNKEKRLPETDADSNPVSYTEYDVNPKQSGADRDAERIVVGSDGRVWYTDDHYGSFSEIT